MRKKVKIFGVILGICCVMFSNITYVMAEEKNEVITKENEVIAEENDGKIYNAEGEVIEALAKKTKGSCTHIPCAHVTDTVWQHRHTGSRCDVYTANATWCKCCNTILKFNTKWVYSYTHYGCTM